MVLRVINKSSIIRTTKSSDGSHEIYADCYDRSAPSNRFYFKLNKHGQHSHFEQRHTLMEVVSGDLFRFFMGQEYTPRSSIVVDNLGRIVGSTSVDMQSIIGDKLKKGAKVCRVKDVEKPLGSQVTTPDQWKDKILNQYDNPNGGFTFLRDQPQNQFDELLEQHQRKVIRLDMKSLAAVLGGSYLFEEDDLHKGNIGYYVTMEGEPEKPTVHFFKIDHDLMFIDSLITRQGTFRPGALSFTDQLFKITVRDLEGFPDLKDSGNHYWPTKRRLMARPSFLKKGDQPYHSHRERQAFKSLKSNEEFIAEKWKVFLKLALIPRDRLDNIISNPELNKPHYQELFQTFQTSLRERLALFRHQLMRSKAFKKYLESVTNDIIDTIKSEIIASYKDTGYLFKADEEDLLEAEIDKIFQCMKDKKNTLERDIELGDYAFDLTRYSSKTSVENACTMVKDKFINATSEQDKYKYSLMMISLSSKLQPLPNEYLSIINFNQTYLQPKTIRSYTAFKAAVLKIRTAALPLAVQKQAVIQLLKEAVNLTSKDELIKLRDILYAPTPQLIDRSLNFINQLRSSLWIVRWWRGAFGATTTASELSGIINSRLRPTIAMNPFGLFSSSTLKPGQIKASDISNNERRPPAPKRSKG